MMRGVLAAAVALFLFLLGAPAWAQSTGGSFGGGSFGSSGGSSSSSSSSGSSSGSSGSSWGSSSSSSSSSYGGGSMPGGLLVIAVGFLVVLMVVGIAAQTAKSSAVAEPAAVFEAEMHTSELAIGVDWRARAELQEGLARMAASGDTATEAGRAKLLGEAALALRRAELSWLYVGYQELGWLAPSAAERAFRNSAADARARFRRELVRNADGVVTEAAPGELAARPEEGPGLIVVTVVTVARRKLRAVTDLRDAASIRAALDDRCSVAADQLVAFEVVWSPAAEDDRMSSAELEQHYPDLSLIDPATIAGRVFCSYCQGPLPMELLRCPHCGAAVADEPPAAPDGPTAKA